MFTITRVLTYNIRAIARYKYVYFEIKIKISVFQTNHIRERVFSNQVSRLKSHVWPKHKSV